MAALLLAWTLQCGFGIKADAASLSSKDIQIFIKALGFLDPPSAGGLVAIAYAQGNPAAEADAEELAGLFGSGLRTGNAVYQARMVDSAALGGGTAYVAVIVAAGTPPEPSMALAKRHHIVCVTADVAQVRAGQCVMAVQSAPRVDIFLHRDLAASAGLTFTAAFRMLVHELSGGSGS